MVKAVRMVGEKTNPSFLRGPKCKRGKDEREGRSIRLCTTQSRQRAEHCEKNQLYFWGIWFYVVWFFFVASLTPELKLSDFKTLALGFEVCTVHEREGTKLIMLIFFCKSTCIYHPKSNSIHFVFVCGVFVANEKRQPGNDHHEEHFECLKYGKRKPS